MKKAFIFPIILFFLLSPLYADQKLDNLFRSGKYKEALEYADQNVPPASRDAGAWVAIARSNEELGFVEKALACFIVSSRLNPNDYESMFGAARIYNKLNQSEDAASLAQKALKLRFTAEASWEYARACITLKRPAEAKDALVKVIGSDPGNIVANRELGIIYLNEKNYAKALPLLEKAYQAKNDPDLANKMGLAYLETGNIDNAIRYLQEAIRKNPTLYEATLVLARAHFKVGNYDYASREFDDALSKISGDPQDYYKRAVAKERQGDKGGALNAYKQAIDRFGSARSTEALLSRAYVGRAFLGSKSYQAAVDALQPVFDADNRGKTIPDIFILLADAYQGLKNVTSERFVLEKAVAANDRNIEAFARLADLYQKSGMQEKARQTYEKMLSLNPTDPNVYLELGKYNLKVNKFDMALELFIKSNSLQVNAPALEGMAISTAALNRWDQARSSAEKALDLDENLWESKIIFARGCLKARDYQRAKMMLEKIVKKEPNNKEYLLDLATCYNRTNDQEKLSEIDRKLAAMDPQNVDSRLRLAEYLYTVKKSYKEAVVVYKELIQLTPQSIEVLRNLVDISKNLGNKNDLAVYLQRYLKLKPNDAVAQRDLGDVLYEKKDLDGALAAYRKAITLDPTLKGFYGRYAEIVIAKGQQEEVIKVMTKMIQTGEAEAGTYTTLGMIYHKKNNYPKAIAMYQKSLQMNPQNTDVLSALGECQAKTGDINGAIISYEQVVMFAPDNAKDQKALGDLYMSDKRVEQAMKAYKKYLDKSPDNAAAISVGYYSFKNKQYDDAIKYLGMVKGPEAEEFDLQIAVGQSYYFLSNYKKVIEVFIPLINRNPKPDNRKVIFKLLAESFEKTKDDIKAAGAYAAFVNVPGVSDNEAAYKSAFLVEKSDPVAAKRRYESNIKNYPRDVRNYQRLGIMYGEDEKTYADARPLLEKAAQMGEAIPEVWLKLARIYGKMGKENDELAACRKYLASEPQNVEVNTRAGFILIKRGAVSEGMIYLETANTVSPNNYRVMSALADGYLKTNRPKNAIELLVKAKSLKPNDPDIRMKLVELYNNAGRNRDAMVEIKELFKIKKDNKYLFIYAGMLQKEGKLQDAENVIADIRTSDPENIDVLMLLAKIQKLQKKNEDAIATYKEIGDLKRDFAPAVCEMAEIYLDMQKFLQAEMFYKRALDRNPKYAPAEYGLAKIARIRKKTDEYLSHLQKAIKLDPANVDYQEELIRAKK